LDTVFHTVRPGNAHATAIAHGMKGFYCFVGDFGFSFDRSVQLDRWEVGSEITVKVQRPRRKDAKMKVAWKDGGEGLLEWSVMGKEQQRSRLIEELQD